MGLTISRIEDLLQAETGEVISFAGGTPHVGDFPLEQLSDVLAQGIERGDLAYGPSRGHPALLGALRDLLTREGLQIEPERLLVTGGAMQGLDLIFRLTLAPGEPVYVEDPTYSDALDALRLTEARVVAMPMDEHGVRVGELPALAAQRGPPRLIYTMPTFQNPTGVTLAGDRRGELVEFAASVGARLVEDDPYGRFRFAGSPLPPLVALGPEVVGVRSLSKVIAPGLRLGYLIAPEPLVSELTAALTTTSICIGGLVQRLAARFIDSGAIEEHLARLTGVFAQRRDTMLAALEERLAGSGVRWSTPEGGMYMWLTLPGGLDGETLLHAALQEGVAVVPGSVFAPCSGHRESVRLCFASVQSAAIPEGVQRLGAAVERSLA